MGLYTPTILGGNSHLSWFYDRWAIKDPAHTGTSKGIAQAIKRGPIRKFLPNYANVYVTNQSHALSAGVRAHYVTGVRNGLGLSGMGRRGETYGGDFLPFEQSPAERRLFCAADSCLFCGLFTSGHFGADRRDRIRSDAALKCRYMYLHQKES